MPAFLFIIFVAVPLIELAILIQVGSYIGVFPTLALVILTAALGTFLLRQQGLSALARAQEQMNRGQMPVEQVLHGLFLLVAGAFLLTPGLVTDAAGFALFVPAVRRLITQTILRRVVSRGGFRFEQHFWSAGGGGFDEPGAGPAPRYPHPQEPKGGGPVIEGEFDADEDGRNDERNVDREDGRQPEERGSGHEGSPWRGTTDR